MFGLCRLSSSESCLSSGQVDAFHVSSSHLSSDSKRTSAGVISPPAAAFLLKPPLKKQVPVLPFLSIVKSIVKTRTSLSSVCLKPFLTIGHCLTLYKLNILCKELLQCFHKRWRCLGINIWRREFYISWLFESWICVRFLLQSLLMSEMKKLMLFPFSEYNC